MAKFKIGDVIRANNSRERYLELVVTGYSKAYGDYFIATAIDSIGYESELIGKSFDLYEGDYELCDTFLQFEAALNKLEQLL